MYKTQLKRCQKVVQPGAVLATAVEMKTWCSAYSHAEKNIVNDGRNGFKLLEEQATIRGRKGGSLAQNGRMCAENTLLQVRNT